MPEQASSQPPPSEPTCEHSDVCGRDALDGHDGKCILHSESPEKDESAFEKALEEHQEEHEGNFRRVVFPSETDFSGDSFEGRVNFRYATFRGKAKFQDATFGGEANFRSANFEDARFTDATFRDKAYFAGATFEKVIFSGAEFDERALFSFAFQHRSGVESIDARFYDCEFRDGATFIGKRDSLAFAGGEVLFKNVKVPPEASLHFRYADLSRCRFLHTDLQDAEFIGVKWHGKVSTGEPFNRAGLYEETAEENNGGDPWAGKDPGQDEKLRPWAEIERLYRELKKNYEERGDFPRAGDFHIGEKEARRRNPNTSLPIKVLLWTYRTLSGYGERALPATFWLLVVVFACAGAYASLGDLGYFEALRYSAQATFFPVEPIGIEGSGVEWVNLLQRVLSPLLLFLLALALRQRVKR